jgi:hypothetical protein
MAAGAFEEVLHGLVMVPDRLLLNDHRPGGEPRVICPGFSQLPTALRETGHLPATGAPLILLLHAQIPHIPSVPTVSQKYGLLFGCRVDTVSVHMKIIANIRGKRNAKNPAVLTTLVPLTV